MKNDAIEQHKVEQPDKACRFTRLAERRVNEVLKKLRLVANLSNKRNYNYTDAQSKLIIDAIESELKYLKIKFCHDAKPSEKQFSLKDNS